MLSNAVDRGSDGGEEEALQSWREGLAGGKPVDTEGCSLPHRVPHNK